MTIYQIYNQMIQSMQKKVFSKTNHMDSMQTYHAFQLQQKTKQKK